MCIYTVKKQKLKKSSRGLRNSTERPQIRRLRHKGYCQNLQLLRHVMLHTGNVRFKLNKSIHAKFIGIFMLFHFGQTNVLPDGLIQVSYQHCKFTIK